jgi:peptidyl-prolyl cis-trans isomerase D
MLDIMRRKKRLKGILWLVIISLGLGMVLLFVPGANVGTVSFDTSAASVAGESIPMKEFVDSYRRMVQSYSAGGKNQVNPETLKALGFDMQTLQALINIRVVGYAAKRLGLEVSPQEIRDAVENNPNLQDRGQFIGVERYKALLAANSLTVTDFEDTLKYSLLMRKVRDVVSDSITVPDKDVRDEFTRANQEAQVGFLTLKQDDFKKSVKPTDADLHAYFDAHKEKYNVKEQRSAQYLLIPLSGLTPTISVTEQEVQQLWDRQEHPEMVSASHILFKVDDPAKEAEVRAKAEPVLKRAKAGEDFAALAQKYSEDTISAKNGGDLGSFARDQMVKEFADVAFALKPGEVSDLVRSQYGFHIIKVTRHEKPDLASNRASLEQSLKSEKASAIAKEKAAEAERLSASQKDLNVIAKALNVPFEIRETPLVAKESDPYLSGISQTMLDEMFRLKEVNSVGKSVDVPTGYALPKLIEVRMPKPADFNESRAAIEKDYVDAKAAELMQAEAKAISEEAKASGDLQKAAQKRKLDFKTPQNFKRDGAPDPDINPSAEFNAAAFDLAVGSISGPVGLSGNRVAVLQIKSRTPFDEAAFDKQKVEIRDRLMSAKQDAYFQEYIRKVTDDLQKEGKIRINPKAMEEVAAQARY